MLLARELPRAGRFAVLGCAMAMVLGVAVQAAHVFLGFGDAVWAQIGNPVEIATGATGCALCGARALLVGICRPVPAAKATEWLPLLSDARHSLA